MTPAPFPRTITDPRTGRDDITIHRVKAGLYEVALAGERIGTIESVGKNDWHGWLLGYRNTTWSGGGRLEDIALSLVDHERDQQSRDATSLPTSTADPFGAVRRQSRQFRELYDANNPEYRFPELDNVLPFKVGVEMIGRSAGRVYLRGKERMVVVTVSDTQLRELRDAIDAALDGRVPEGI